MKDRLKKKAKTYKKLSNKKRLKNQSKAIRQLHLEVIRLKADKAYLSEKLSDAVDIIKQYENGMDGFIDNVDSLEKQINRLEMVLKPWWRKLFKKVGSKSENMAYTHNK